MSMKLLLILIFSIFMCIRASPRAAKKDWQCYPGKMFRKDYCNICYCAESGSNILICTDVLCIPEISNESTSVVKKKMFDENPISPKDVDSKVQNSVRSNHMKEGK